MATVPSQDRRAPGQSRSSIIQSSAVIAKVRGQNLGDVGNRLAKKPVDRFQAVSDSQDDHDQDYTMFGRLSAQTLKQLKQRLRDACHAGRSGLGTLKADASAAVIADPRHLLGGWGPDSSTCCQLN